MRALILVHVSSLAAYASEEGAEAAELLFKRMLAAVQTHQGPVVIVDQFWKEMSEELRWLDDAAEVHWIRFDEATMDWEPFLRKLWKHLRKIGVADAVMGGVWYHPGGEAGCVNAVEEYLRERIPVTVDSSLVGCADWSREMGMGSLGADAYVYPWQRGDLDEDGRARVMAEIRGRRYRYIVSQATAESLHDLARRQTEMQRVRYLRRHAIRTERWNAETMVWEPARD